MQSVQKTERRPVLQHLLRARHFRSHSNPALSGSAAAAATTAPAPAAMAACSPHSHRSRVCSTHPRAECMRSFSNPGLTDSQTRSGLASAVTIAAAAVAAACTLCVSPRHSARHMLGVVRAMRASRVSARRVCEKHLNECELGPQDTNERERWRKCRGRRVTHTPTHTQTHSLSTKKRPRLRVSLTCAREL